MIVALGFFSGDVEQATELLEWIHKLGGCKEFEILLVADSETPFDKTIKARSVALQAFKAVHLTTAQAQGGWPKASNQMWRAAALWCESKRHDWLWMEADAIPITSDWLARIAQEWDQKNGHAEFLGAIYDGENQFAGRKFMSGIAVYRHNATATMVETDAAWDVSNSERMVTNGSHTALIKSLFGQINPPPRFVRERTARTRPHEFALDYLGDAALFHRSKDGSLLRLLRKKLFPNEILRKPIAVVFPVHNGDLEHAIHHAGWMQRIANPKWKHEAIVAFDTTINVVRLNHFTQQLRACFETVHTFTYPRPPFQQYPHAANWAFQNVAHEMQRRDLPWLWAEADGVVLRSTWLDELQHDYETCGADFIGNVVEHMLHTNGVAIYPPDTPTKMPGAMQAVEQAFDMMGKIGHVTHNTDRLFHLWTLLNRMPHPVGGGDLPANITADELRRWLPRESVFLHRIKDHSVINLMLGGYKHE